MYMLLLGAAFPFLAEAEASDSPVTSSMVSGVEELRRAEALCSPGYPAKVEIKKEFEKKPAVGSWQLPDESRLPNHLRELAAESLKKTNEGFSLSSHFIVQSDGKDIFIQAQSTSVMNPDTTTTQQVWYIDGKTIVDYTDYANAGIRTGLNFQGFPEGEKILAYASCLPFHYRPEIRVFGGRLSDFVKECLKEVVIVRTPAGFSVEGTMRDNEGAAIQMKLNSAPCLRLVEMARTRPGLGREEWKFIPTGKDEVFPYKHIEVLHYGFNKKKNEYYLSAKEHLNYSFEQAGDEFSVPRPKLAPGKSVTDLDTNMLYTVDPSGLLLPDRGPVSGEGELLAE